MTATTFSPRTIGISWNRVLAAEGRKQVSLRSTWWTLAVLILAIAGSGVISALGVYFGQLDPVADEIGPLGGALAGISSAEIVVLVIGVLAATGEYASGVVHSTFTAVPARTPVVLAKAGVVGASVLAASAALTVGTFGADRILYANQDFDLPITAPGVLRSLLGAAVFLGLFAMIGTAMGWLLRSTAGAVGAMLGLLFGLPIVGLMIPDTYAASITRYLPANAGSSMMEPLHAPGMLPAWAGFAVMLGWTAVFLTAAVLVIRRRDA
jgi:ABC-2 type transport system permease protein